MKILLTDTATLVADNDISLDIFKSFGNTVEFDNINHDELKTQAADTEIILCNKTVIDREIIEAAPKLRYIGTFATGYNNIDIAAAKSHGVTVCNAAEYSTNAVAQQVIGYILIHYTQIPRYDNFVKEGGWKKSVIFSHIAFGADEVYDKVLGIVGYGSIGKAVAKAAKGLGMKVKVYTRTPRPDGETEFVSFEELLEASDIITMHCPLNSESEKMMNSQAFGKMKKGAFFINTSRGGVVDEAALSDALKSGQLSGAAVDVLTKEPMSENCVLADAPNIIITPHSAWSPLSTRKRLVKLVAENLTAFLEGNPKSVVSN